MFVRYGYFTLSHESNFETFNLELKWIRTIPLHILQCQYSAPFTRREVFTKFTKHTTKKRFAVYTRHSSVTAQMMCNCEKILSPSECSCVVIENVYFTADAREIQGCVKCFQVRGSYKVNNA